MTYVRSTLAPLAAALLTALSGALSASPAQARPAALPFQCPDKAERQAMIHVDGAFARASNSWKSGAIGRMLKFQCYTLIGRDGSGEWLYVNYGPNTAWIHRNDARLKDGESPDTLKVLYPADLIAPKPLSARYSGVPSVSAAMRARYAAAVKAGRAPDVVAVMGDCNSEAPVFFGRFAMGVVNLSALPELQRTAEFFAPSFQRPSAATSGSFSTAMAFDSTWSDPKQCAGGENPLSCELRKSNASLIVIALGTGDTFDWQAFEANYRRIVDYALQNNTVPLLMTKADALDSQQGGAASDYINSVVRRVGAEYGVPVIDFALGAKGLPNNGLVDEYNLEGKSIAPFHINEEAMDARIVMTLQTLAQFTSAPARPAAKRTPVKPRKPAAKATPAPTRKP
jgi:hypothetical protein